MITIYTGAGGMDLFNEMMENQLGWERIYISKIPRFLAQRVKFRKSLSRRYYRLSPLAY